MRVGPEDLRHSGAEMIAPECGAAVADSFKRKSLPEKPSYALEIVTTHANRPAVWALGPGDPAGERQVVLCFPTAIL